MLSPKVRDIATPASIATAAKAKEMLLEGIDVIDLSIGQPDFSPPIDASSVAQISGRQTSHAYSGAAGIASLRQELAGYLQEKHILKIVDEEIVITPGAKLGLYYLLSVLLEDGDSVVIPEPSWLSYSELVNWVGGRPICVDGEESNSFLVDPEDIIDALQVDTRVVILNSPVNPTGVVWPVEAIRYLYAELKKRRTFLILDAIYDDFVFGSQVFKMSDISSQGVPENFAYIHGFSKVYSMAGHRLGYICAQPTVVSAVAKVQSQLMTCPSSFSQYMALEILQNRNQVDLTYLDKYEVRSLRVQELLIDSDIGFIRPDATFYIMVKIDFISPSSVAAAKIILEECLVAVVPGVAYGKSAEGYVRLSLVQPLERIEAAVERICDLKTRIRIS